MDSKSADRKVVGVRPPLPAPQDSKVVISIWPLDFRGAKIVWWPFWWLLILALTLAIVGREQKGHQSQMHHGTDRPRHFLQ